MQDWYDYPQYFDMIFRDETVAEVRFFEHAFERFVTGKTVRLLEPGCGSGRLVAAMAKLGYRVTGLDRNEAMLGYLRQRLSRRGLAAELVLGDMTRMHFGNQQAFDACFCTFNTFRHLLSEADAIAHLTAVANCLRPGGIYILGFHCIPLDADPECTERWRANHAGTQVHVTLKVIEFNRRKRQERLRVSIKATTRQGKIRRIRSEFPLRLYTPAQAEQLLNAMDGQFEIAEVFDFDYDIDQPRRIDDDLTEALFVLRRR